MVDNPKGIAESKIDAFFAKPTVLPMQEFHHSIDSAMAQQSPYDITIEGSNEPTSVIEFTAWNTAAPFIKRPERQSLTAAPEVELNSVLLQIEVGEDGLVRGTEVLDSSLDDQWLRSRASTTARRMVFRANPDENMWRSNSRMVNLVYKVPQ